MAERWLWAQDYKSASIFTDKTRADAFLDLVGDAFTDVMLTTRDDKDGRVYFDATLTAVRPERIDGKPGGVYLIDELHKRGVRVHAWLYSGFWGTYIRMHEPPPSEWNMRAHPDYEGSWCNFSIEAMREQMAVHTIDLAKSNDFDGVHLDYLRLRGDNLDCPFITFDHVTDVAERIRAGIHSGHILTAAFSGRGADMARRQRRDVWTWLQQDGLFDWLQMMSYVTQSLQDRYDWMMSLPNNEQVLPGVPTFARDADGKAIPSYENCIGHTAWWNERDRHDLAYFDSWTLRQAMVDDLPTLGEPPEPEPPTLDYARVAQLYRALASEFEKAGG